jgi:hypothetical protein
VSENRGFFDTCIVIIQLVKSNSGMPELTNNELKTSHREDAKDEMLVPVQIAYGATKLGKMARPAGGEWDQDVKLWYIQYDRIKGTELEQHIILDAKKKGSQK